MRSPLAGVALCATLAACSSPRDNAGIRSDAVPTTTDSTLTFEDPAGRPVRLATLPVTRIVSTMQNMTEWIVALGAESLLVARTDYDRQAVLAGLPSIGGGLDPSPETIAALDPDVIIGWRNRSSADLQRALEPFGIPVISLETTDTSDMYANLERIGVLVGREARADSLARALRADLASSAASCSGRVAESAMLVLWSDPPMTAGSGTWMHELLGLACLRNAFADLAAPWPTISMEAITVRQPHWIVTSAGERVGQRLAEFRGKPGWRELEAVKAGRIVEVPGDLFARAGVTLPLAVAAIRRGMEERGARSEGR